MRCYNRYYGRLIRWLKLMLREMSIWLRTAINLSDLPAQSLARHDSTALVKQCRHWRVDTCFTHLQIEFFVFVWCEFCDIAFKLPTKRKHYALHTQSTHKQSLHTCKTTTVIKAPPPQKKEVTLLSYKIPPKFYPWHTLTCQVSPHKRDIKLY